MRIALAQLNYHIGNFDGNLAKMLDAIEQAKSQSADLICFGELATCGYPPRDFLEFSDFINKAQQTIEQLIEASQDIGIIVGSPVPNLSLKAKIFSTLPTFCTKAKCYMFHIKRYYLPTMSLTSTDILNLPAHFQPSRLWASELL